MAASRQRAYLGTTGTGGAPLASLLRAPKLVAGPVWGLLSSSVLRAARVA